MDSKFGIFGEFGWVCNSIFGRQTGVRKCLKYGFSGFRPVSGRNRVWYILEGFERVRSLVLVNEPGFD